MDIIKNPIVIGIIVGALVYICLKWYYYKQNNDDKKDGQTKTNTEVSIIPPIVAGVVAYFLSYYFLNKCDKSGVTLIDVPSNKNVTKTNSISESPQTFYLVNKGVNIPNKLPDILIDTF